MLSGRYPSDEFAELRPRVTWDRVAGTIAAREGAKRVAIANGGTIPDRGLYGVFLLGARARRGARRRARRRNGVREPRRRDVRARRLVLAHRGDHARPRARLAGAGRAGQDAVLERRSGRPAARARPRHRTPDARSAAAAAAGRDRAADARARPRCSAPPRTCCSTCAIRSAATRRRSRRQRRSSSSACATSSATGASACCRRAADGSTRRGRWPRPAKIREETGDRRRDALGRRWVRRAVPGRRSAARSAAAASRIPTKCRRWSCGSSAPRRSSPRSSARTPARSLLLPEAPARACARRCGSSASAPPICSPSPSRYGSFPVLLETYRECLRDFFDMPALVQTLADLRSRKLRVVDRRFREAVAVCRLAALQLRRELSSTTATRRSPSAARRRSPSIRRSCASCSATRSCASCSIADAIDAVERQLQRLDPKYHARSVDGVHDMLLAIGDLTTDEIAARSARRTTRRASRTLGRSAPRAAAPRSPASTRYVAVEDAARYRDALGVPLPPGVARGAAAAGARSARRSRAALRADARAVHRDGLRRRATASTPAVAEAVLMRLAGEGRLIEGEFRPGGTRREWTDADVLRMLRRRSLAKLRTEVEPVDQAALGRLRDDLAGDRQAPARRRRAARRDRTAAGRAAARVDPRNRNSAGAHRRLRSRRSRRRDGGGRSRLGRRRAARRA